MLLLFKIRKSQDFVCEIWQYKEPIMKRAIREKHNWKHLSYYIQIYVCIPWVETFYVLKLTEAFLYVTDHLPHFTNMD